MFTVSSHVLLQNYVYSMLHTVYSILYVQYTVLYHFQLCVYYMAYTLCCTYNEHSVQYTVHTGWARTLWTNRKKPRFSLINLLISIVIALLIIGFVDWCMMVSSV